MKSPLKIVYVDDEKDLCNAFKDLFSGDQIQIITFTDWNRAIEQISKDPPGLIFLDYRLGTITGQELAHMLPKEIPKGLITGELNLILDPIFEKIFMKPFETKVIKEFIKSYL